MFVSYTAVPEIDPSNISTETSSPVLTPAFKCKTELSRLYSRTSSRYTDDASGSEWGTVRRKDRRRGRLINSELLSDVLEGRMEEVRRWVIEGASVNATCRSTYTTVLHIATICEYAEIVKFLLSKGASTNLRDKEGRQAVHFAAASGNEQILKIILDKDISTLNSQINVDSVDRTDNDCLDSWSHDHKSIADKIPCLISGSTPLHLAAQRVNYMCVKLLLEMDARTDILDDRGLSSLDVAGEIALKSPPPPEITDKFTDNMLHDNLHTMDVTSYDTSEFDNKRASFELNRKMALLLLPSIPNSRSPSPSNSQVIPDEKSLSDKSNNIQINGSNSTTRISMPNSIKKSISTAEKVFSALIMKGAKMFHPKKNTVNEGGIINQQIMSVTCLHTAVESGKTDLIEYLLKNGGCVLTWNGSGLTPIHLAVVKRLLEPLRELLEWDKSLSAVDVRDSTGRTPLYLAVEEEWTLGVSFLLEAGADIKVTSNENQTVLHLAAKKCNINILEELLSIPDSVEILNWRNKVYETPLCCAVSAGQLLAVELLLEHGADIEIYLPGDITLLHIAVENGNQMILDTLLRHPDVQNLIDIRSHEGKGGMTPLHVSALGGFINCVKSLIAANCNLYAKTTNFPHFGATALHLAAKAGNVDVVTCIVTRDRKTLCAKNKDNWYPLHVAAQFSQKECVIEMLKNGANLAATIIDSCGNKKTGLDIIVYNMLHPHTFLENIFDSFINVNEYPLNDPKCLIYIKYNILVPLGSDRKQLRVLDSLLNCSKQILQENLLLHPLVETFLFLKWKKLRLFFFLIMALYMTFTLSLTSMAMFIYVLKTDVEVFRHSTTVCRVVLLTSLALIIVQELMHAGRLHRYYFKDFESWLKWSAFLTASIVVLFDHSMWWLIHITTISVLLAWLELLFLLSRWPSSIGFYILMFFKVANKVMKVLATFMFVIIGFTFTFLIHFRASKSFTNWWEALVKVIAMTSEFDYVQTFDSDKEVTLVSIVGRSIFLVYLLLVAIVLMNLLVGLAVSDIATLERQGRAQRLAKQIDFLNLLELFVYNKKILYCCPQGLVEAIKRLRTASSYMIIEPGKPLRITTFQNLPQQMKQSVINKVQQMKLNQADKLSNCQVDVDHFSNRRNTSIKSCKTLCTSLCALNSDTQPVHQKENKLLERILLEIKEIKQEIDQLKSGNMHTVNDQVK